MRIALVMPKSTFLETPMVWQPLGLLYLASRLKSLGHHADFFDLNEDELPQDGDYDQIWVSATSPQMSEIKRIAEATKNWKTKRVLGGPAAWADPLSVQGLGYDLTVGGECDSEEAVKRILSSTGHLMIPVSRTLDWVLPPERGWSWRYKSTMRDRDGQECRMTTMFTSRGCPLTCAFCESGRLGVIWDKYVRYEPLSIVEKQIREISLLGYSGLAYYDDILPLDKKRTLELMAIHRNYNMVWRCFLRSDIICNHGEREYLKALADGGLIEIFVGVESADNRIKENIHKKTTIEQDAAILQWCRELGIRMKTSFILGLPGESRESMETTRRWILEHRPDRVQVGRLIPFAGTPLAGHPERFDLVYERQPPDEWFYSGDNGYGTHSFVSTSHLTRDEIDVFWHKLMDELKNEGIPA